MYTVYIFIIACIIFRTVKFSCRKAYIRTQKKHDNFNKLIGNN